MSIFPGGRIPAAPVSNSRARNCAQGLLLGSLLAVTSTALSATPLTIRSIQNGPNQQIGPRNDSSYVAITDLLIASGHTIVSPGTWSGTMAITPGSLVGVDLLYIPASASFNDNYINNSAAELRSFVQNGGDVILESDSEGFEGNAQDYLAALELPLTIDKESGERNGRELGQFIASDQLPVTSDTHPLGGLRFGSTAGSYLSENELASVEHTVLGRVGNLAWIVELHPYADGGRVIFLGDPLFADQVTSPQNRFYNPNNLAFAANLLSYLGGGPIVESPDCDLNRDGDCTAADIDLLSQTIRANDYSLSLDLNQDQTLNDIDRTTWVESPSMMNTFFGDANLDGEFNTTDLVQVFQAGTYEDNVAGNSGWADGDWDGSGDFGTGDLVRAFQGGGFEQGPRAAVTAVPEPAVWWPALLTCGLGLRRRTG